MSKSGQNNFKGINKQAQVALFVFLQHLSDPNFSHIHLESDNWEDFDIHFTNNKKIFEVKNWKRPLSIAQLKTILTGINNSDKKLDGNDSIVVACNRVGGELREAMKAVSYMHLIPDNIFVKKGFSDDLTQLLAKTSFMEFGDKDLNNEVHISLYRYVPFWLPPEDIESMCSTILVEKIYNRSAKGDIFSKQEFEKDLDKYKTFKIEHSNYYDDQKVELEKQLESILNAIDKDDPVPLQRANLTSLTAQPAKMFLLLDRLKRKVSNISLEKWDFLWDGIIKHNYIFTLFHILKESAQNKKDAEYVIKFLTKNLSLLDHSGRVGLFQQESIQITNDFLIKYPNLVSTALEFVQNYLSVQGNRYKTKELGDNSHDKELMAQLIEAIFNISRNKKDDTSVETIIRLIDEYFDIVSDDGEFSMYASNKIFWVLRDYININFKQNLPIVVSLLVEQFHKKYTFDGKGFGSGISRSGDNFNVSDKHFVTYTLEQAINTFYLSSKRKSTTWSWLKKTCLTTDLNKISPNRPDFLNRALFGVLFERYKNGTAIQKQEVLTILNEFLLTDRSLGGKACLIFHRLNILESPFDDKWQLVEKSLTLASNPQRLPINVFVDVLVSQLAEKGYQPALDLIKEWSENKNYSRQQGTMDYGMDTHIKKLLASSTYNTYVQGVELFDKYINSKAFIRDLDRFDVYGVARQLGSIIKKDAIGGIAILEHINQSKNLTPNQQVLLWGSINKIEDDVVLQHRLYTEFMYPTLEKLDWDIKKIYKRFPDNYSRQCIVEFAEKLAVAKLFNEALRVANIFAYDPNPVIDASNPDSLHSRLAKGDEDRSITSVKGWVCWVLNKFIVTDGKKYISKIIPIVKQLSDDPNHYIRYEVCIPLSSLMKVRYATLPHDPNQKFIGKQNMKKIEKISLTMLKDPRNHSINAIMTNLAGVFSYMRQISYKRAWDIIQIFHNANSNSGTVNYCQTLIFFAEYSKSSKTKNNLEKNSYKKIKDLLVDLSVNGSEKIRQTLSWNFCMMVEEDQDYKTGIKYLHKIITRYDLTAFSRIYYLIDQQINTHYAELYDLYIKCLSSEKNGLITAISEGEPVNASYVSHYHHREILKQITKRNKKELLECLEIISQYPIFDWVNLKPASAELVKISTNKKIIGKIFDNLISKDLIFFEDKKKWLKNIGDASK